jgi:predicted nucleic acid-binding protein
MLYFDTSFLVPLFLQEATSTRIERFIRSRKEELVVSQWTRVEFSSALAREVRMGALDKKSALDANEQFDAIVSKSFALLTPTADDFDLAKRYVSTYETRLRAGDALHLAIANNRGATAIYSLDKSFLAAGRRLRLPVRAGIRK